MNLLVGVTFGIFVGLFVKPLWVACVIVGLYIIRVLL